MLNELTIAYLFLGGAGAGAALVLTLVSWLVEGLGLRRAYVDRADLRFFSSHVFVPLAGERRLFGLGYVVAATTQVLGLLCLLFDMGRPDMALLLLVNPHPTVTSIGALALMASVALCAGLALVWLGALHVRRRTVRCAGAFAMVSAFVVAAYTALLLRALGAGQGFWASPWLVALFVASSISTGIALVVGPMIASGASLFFDDLVTRLLHVDALVIVAEGLVLAAFMLSGWYIAPQAVSSLLTGGLAEVFWVGFVGCGLVAPLALDVGVRVMRGLIVHPAALCTLVLVGGFCLRWCVALVPR